MCSQLMLISRLRTGLKPQLVARLSKVLKTEESEAALIESANERKDDIGENNDSNADVHESASNDSMDIDLADIMVIDEYDSTKNDTKNESSSKRVCNFDHYTFWKEN